MFSASSQRRNRLRSSRLVVLLGAALSLAGPVLAGEPTVAGLDPRVELGEVAYWLHARPPRPKIITPATEKYLDQIKARFGPLVGHPAVALAAAYAPPSVSSPSRGFHVRSAIAIKSSAKHPWTRKLRDFAGKAGFKKFFDKNVRLYSAPIKKFRKR